MLQMQVDNSANHVMEVYIAGNISAKRKISFSRGADDTAGYEWSAFSILFTYHLPHTNENANYNITLCYTNIYTTLLHFVIPFHTNYNYDILRKVSWQSNHDRCGWISQSPNCIFFQASPWLSFSVKHRTIHGGYHSSDDQRVSWVHGIPWVCHMGYLYIRWIVTFPTIPRANKNGRTINFQTNGPTRFSWVKCPCGLVNSHEECRTNPVPGGQNTSKFHFWWSKYIKIPFLMVKIHNFWCSKSHFWWSKSPSSDGQNPISDGQNPMKIPSSLSKSWDNVAAPCFGPGPAWTGTVSHHHHARPGHGKSHELHGISGDAPFFWQAVGIFRSLSVGPWFFRSHAANHKVRQSGWGCHVCGGQCKSMGNTAQCWSARILHGSSRPQLFSGKSTLVAWGLLDFCSHRTIQYELGFVTTLHP